MKKELEEFRAFCSDNPELLGVKSVIWQRLSEDFGSKFKNVRGYGVNNLYDSRRVFFFLRLNSLLLAVLDFARTAGIWIGRVMKLVWSRILSFLVFQSIFPAKQYSFKDYKAQDYQSYEEKTGNLTKFFERPTKSKYGVEFSHHTFKLYCYLSDLHKEVPDFELDQRSVLEIGGGMLNFAVLCNEEVDELFYVVVDLPEVIEAAYFNVSKVLNDVEIFLPHQKSEALTSQAKKKLLLLVPGQLDDLEHKFDLFVNHESFAEMDISIVENYLGSVSKKMNSESIVFLVNRFFRVQNSDARGLVDVHSINQVTSFDRYKPNWCEEVTYKVETFRQHISTQNDRPNAFFIGKVR